MKRQLFVNLAMAAVILAVALGLKWAQHQGLVGAQSPTRWTMTIIGLSMAANANLMPKDGRQPSSARGIALRRISSWSMFLAGLAYAAVWAFTPLSDAAYLSVAAVAAAIVWVIAACILARRPKQPLAS